MKSIACAAVAAMLVLGGCTQERQNQIKRDIQNWTGTDGVLEVYGGDKVVKRFLKIDKLSRRSEAPMKLRSAGDSNSGLRCTTA